ncbi:hypothetical protein CEUSTIGMA_g9183.t1 [Chlamydomonas eustigma]|uniref:Centrosomal protein of 44 kDa n=1 Tax=Chlamydomonas eustigma TaxID=1157962 RepID=A0A250XFA9_9CHLO|nr:hypothetical protein CEUSTIGMA_g9183.t1 [Chlamydomonas eustigma]|eukprot:GAX81755.1 hypothetical protein CEUSTIGMA_g9183.t1 [Chlamydomonas eustigma]
MDDRLKLGDPASLLPLFHFVLLRFSRHVATCITSAGYELQGKTDQRFVENCFKLLRDCFNIRAVLTVSQFLEQGFAERKILLLCDVISACKKIHNDEIRKERLAALKSRVGAPSNVARLHEPNRKTPDVKIVKAGGQEIKQVVSPIHLPNATGGAQSLYAVKQHIISPTSRLHASALSSGLKTGAIASTPPGLRATPTAGPAWLQQGSSSKLKSSPNYTASATSAATEGSSWLHSWLEPSQTPSEHPSRHDHQQGYQQGQQQEHQQVEQSLIDDTWPQRDMQRNGSLAGSSYKAGGVQRPPEVSVLSDNNPVHSHQQSIHSWFMNPEFSTNSPSQLKGIDSVIKMSSKAAEASQAVDDYLDTSEDPRDARQDAHGPQDARQDAHGPQDATQVFATGDATCDSYEAEVGGGISAGNFTFSNWNNVRPQSQSSSILSVAEQGLRAMHQGGQHLLESFGSDTVRSHVPQPVRRYSDTTTSLADGREDPDASAPTVAAGGDGSMPIVGSVYSVTRTEVEAMEARFRVQVAETDNKLKALEEQVREARQELVSTRDTVSAKVTVLEGRVRFLECELEGCVRRGEYQPPGKETSNPAVGANNKADAEQKSASSPTAHQQHQLHSWPGPLASTKSPSWNLHSMGPPNAEEAVVATLQGKSTSEIPQQHPQHQQQRSSRELLTPYMELRGPHSYQPQHPQHHPLLSAPTPTFGFKPELHSTYAHQTMATAVHTVTTSSSADYLTHPPQLHASSISVSSTATPHLPATSLVVPTRSSRDTNSISSQYEVLHMSPALIHHPDIQPQDPRLITSAPWLKAANNLTVSSTGTTTGTSFKPGGTDQIPSSSRLGNLNPAYCSPGAHDDHFHSSDEPSHHHSYIMAKARGDDVASLHQSNAWHHNHPGGPRINYQVSTPVVTQQQPGSASQCVSYEATVEPRRYESQSVEGSGAASGSSTNDLINSLVKRYTEAQSFLNHMRQSQDR